MASTKEKRGVAAEWEIAHGVSQCACMLRRIDDAGLSSVAGQPLLWVGWPLGFLQGADIFGPHVSQRGQDRRSAVCSRQGRVLEVQYLGGVHSRISPDLIRRS